MQSSVKLKSLKDAQSPEPLAGHLDLTLNWIYSFLVWNIFLNIGAWTPKAGMCHVVIECVVIPSSRTTQSARILLFKVQNG
jgi:hypothetical protein